MALLAGTAGAGGCSDECATSRCAAGNVCIDDGSGVACHKVCTTQGACPSGWYCNDGQLGSQGKNWCVQNTSFPPQGPGQWGDKCPPSGGEGANPACDWNDGFACYGTSPTAGASFCTEYGCAQDSDCPGGWWCSTQNQGPNVTSPDPTFGKTRQICLPRRYCAPCQTDHDCAQDMTPQHCAPDVQGNGYCAPQCTGSTDCALDAECVVPWEVCLPSAGQACTVDDDCPATAGTFQHCTGGHCTPECGSDADCSGPGQKCSPASLTLCKPRAGVCVGDGGFCSPCRSDLDCKDGFCVSGAPYSTERFCSAKSSVDPCDATIPNPPGCPPPAAGDNWKEVDCASGVPQQCVAHVTLGAGTVDAQLQPGCWTVNR